MSNTAESPAELRAISPREFEQFRKLAYEKFGLDLDRWERWWKEKNR